MARSAARTARNLEAHSWLQVQFGPKIVAPAFNAIAAIAPRAAATILAGIKHNAAAWAELGTSCSAYDVLTQPDGSVKELHVFGGSALSPDGGDAGVTECVH
jgi:hypothetical protein